MTPLMLRALRQAYESPDHVIRGARQTIKALERLGYSTYDAVLTDRGRLFVAEEEYPCSLCGMTTRALGAGAICDRHSTGGPTGDGLSLRQRTKLGHGRS